MRSRLLLLAALAASAGTAATGQIIAPPPDAETVQRFSEAARDNLTRARLPDGSFVPAETPAERERPLISETLAGQVVRRGYLSGEMQVCNLDSSAESFLPFMQSLRATRRHTDKQLAYIGLLHGHRAGVRHLDAGAPCPVLLRRERAEAAAPGAGHAATCPLSGRTCLAPAVRVWHRDETPITRWRKWASSSA